MKCPLLRSGVLLRAPDWLNVIFDDFEKKYITIQIDKIIKKEKGL